MRVRAPAVILACGAISGAVLDGAPAFAGGQAAVAIGPPAPVFIPPPSSIPAPLPLQPVPNGAGVAPVQPLPPLVLYGAPALVIPSARHDRDRRR